MKVYNVHERVVRCTKKQAQEIMSTYGSLTDRMYPFDRWPNMYLEGPPGPTVVGSVFNRGAARLVITLFENGEQLRYSWKFLKPAGFDGTHTGSVVDLGNGTMAFRSVIDMHTRGWKATLLWLFVMHSLHDAVVGDSFDKLERELGLTPKARTWTPWVRLLRRLKRVKSTEYQRLHREQVLP